jgi:hypothetical protein
MGLGIYAWRGGCTASAAETSFHSMDGPQGPVRARLWTDGPFQSPLRKALRQALGRYQSANIELDKEGMTARNSPPPVKKCIFLIAKTRG